MFAYCGNNPISFVDHNGKCFLVFDFVDTETEVEETTTGKVSYKTVITVTSVTTFWGIPIWQHTTTHEFYYSVKSNGLITFNNDQENARYLGLFHDPVWRNELAREMISVAQKQVPGSLKGRTVSGVRLELTAHYTGFYLHIKPSHTDVTEIGGYDVDPNADWFEHPIMNSPFIIYSLLFE